MGAMGAMAPTEILQRVLDTDARLESLKIDLVFYHLLEKPRQYQAPII